MIATRCKTCLVANHATIFHQQGVEKHMVNNQKPDMQIGKSRY